MGKFGDLLGACVLVPKNVSLQKLYAMELLQHLLLYSPIQRMKGADALKHSFLCG